MIQLPEAYTHIRTARLALKSAGITCKSKAAFEMGANGPDPFFAYKPLTRETVPPMKLLGERLHREHCGLFLYTLVVNAKTPAQQSYAMGFLSHNALDALAHPYIAFLTSKGQCYHRAHGHGYYEVALDSKLYKKDYGTLSVNAKDTAPCLITAELAEVCELLQQCIAEVFALDISLEGIADSFHWFYGVHRFFACKFGVRKAIVAVIETLAFHKGLATSHMTPAHMEKNMPKAWTNPYTGTVLESTITELLQPATEISEAFFKSADAFWQGRITDAQLKRIIGDHSYDTGLASETESGEAQMV
ncbi:MAG: zinc dependent phospholipase C family protein [Oscillospiraceae bacterium]